MGPHGHVTVNVDPEVADRRNWLHVSGANADRTRRDLMLSTRRCAPENFSTGVIQLQPIGCHPSSKLIDTDGHFLAEVGRICLQGHSFSILRAKNAKKVSFVCKQIAGDTAKLALTLTPNDPRGGVLTLTDPRASLTSLRA